MGFYKSFLEANGSSDELLFTIDSNGLYEAIAEAHGLAFGLDGLPRVDLQAAKMIVGIGTDFLEVGTSPVYQSKAFFLGHSYRNGKMGKFIQFESVLS